MNDIDSYEISGNRCVVIGDSRIAGGPYHRNLYKSWVKSSFFVSIGGGL